jgi:putative tricarboxylic transport membrane protein
MLAVLVMIESVRLSLDSIHSPGPGFVPFFLGLSLAVLSLLSLLVPDQQVKTEAFWNNWERGRNVFFIFAGLGIYLLLLRSAGFFIDTFLLMIYLMKFSGEKGYQRAIVTSALTMVFIYFLFYKLLSIPLPKGMVGV